jgi:hypothetical protein
MAMATLLNLHRRALVALMLGGVLVLLWVRSLEGQRAEGQRAGAGPTDVPAAQLIYVSRTPVQEWELEGAVAAADLERILLRRRGTTMPQRQLLNTVHGGREYRPPDFDDLSGPHLIKAVIKQEGGIEVLSAPDTLTLIPTHRFTVPLLVKNERPRPELVTAEVAGRALRLTVPASGVRGYSINVRMDQAGTSRSTISFKGEAGSKELPLTVEVRPSGTVKVRLSDRKGSRAAARVYLTGSDGFYYSPQGSLSRMTLGGEYFFYAEREFEVVLPAGTAIVEAVRGIEYAPARKEVTVAAGETRTVDLELARGLQLDRSQWYSADAHIHANYVNNEVIDLEDIDLQVAAEDLDNANLMVANSYSGVIHDQRFFEGRPNRASRGRTVLYWNEEMRNRALYGHMAFFNLKELVHPLYTGFPGTPYFEDYPPNHDQAAKAKAQNGAVTYVHPATQPRFQGNSPVGAREFPVDLALGKVDALDVLSNYNDMAAMELWYRALNCGFRCAISAGTDAFTNQVMGTVPGAGRVYVNVPGAFSYERWVESYRKGASFASNGPALAFTVDGKMAGGEIRFPSAGKKAEVRVKATVDTLVPVERLEIVANGVVVASQTAAAEGGKLEIDKVIPLERSSWVAARALGPAHRLVLNDAQTFAHTSPVYCYLGTDPIWNPKDAAFWADWIDQLVASVEERGVFASPERRDTVIRLFRTAQDVYRRGPGR